MRFAWPSMDFSSRPPALGPPFERASICASSPNTDGSTHAVPGVTTSDRQIAHLPPASAQTILRIFSETAMDGTLPERSGRTGGRAGFRLDDQPTGVVSEPDDSEPSAPAAATA